uniref:VWFA domain-containing protein n=1 Tax=Amazona collaria TaxID=241587 RepID=A0A8B9FGE7_9PSIT
LKMLVLPILLSLRAYEPATHTQTQKKKRSENLLFVIDSSESVGPENFNIIKTFMKTVIDKVLSSHFTTRMGIINFSHKVELVSSLKQYASKESLKLAVDDMPYFGEGTYTAFAIQETIRLFQAARPAVRKVAVVITDGQADNREDIQLDSAVRKAHAANIEIFVIGIVQRTKSYNDNFLKEMQLIATDPDDEHVYQIDDFMTLSEVQISSTLVLHLCIFLYFIWLLSALESLHHLLQALFWCLVFFSESHRGTYTFILILGEKWWSNTE